MPFLIRKVDPHREFPCPAEVVHGSATLNLMVLSIGMWSSDSQSGKCPLRETAEMHFLNLTVQKEPTMNQSKRKTLIKLTHKNMTWRNYKEEIKNSDKKLRKGDKLRNDCLYFTYDN